MKYYSTPSDHLQKADLVVVFPSEKARISAGFNLIQQGFADSLAIINTTSEALTKKAKKHRLPSSPKYIDGGSSRSTFEDVYTTRQIIRHHEIQSLILVTSSYHMPRAVFLLKTLNRISGKNLKMHVFPVHVSSDYDLAKKLKLCYNENIKLWGSLAEMIIFQFTRKLPADIKSLSRVRSFLKSHLLLAL